MDFSKIFIPLVIGALVIISVLMFVFRHHRAEQRLSPLAGLAFGFILAGLFTGDDRLIGYSLFSIGILLAFIDIIRKIRSKKQPS